MSTTAKKRARELQAIGKGAVSYTTCLRLFQERGFDEAKKQIEAWVREGDAEVQAMK